MHGHNSTRVCAHAQTDRLTVNQLPKQATGQQKRSSHQLPPRPCVVLQVCRGLAALESCRPLVLHRDVKPSNVFIDAAGVARLGDFGLSRAMPDNR